MGKADLTEKELEELLHSSRFVNEEHKEALRKQLFGKRAAFAERYLTPLSDEELELAAGERPIPRRIPCGPMRTCRKKSGRNGWGVTGKAERVKALWCFAWRFEDSLGSADWFHGFRAFLWAETEKIKKQLQRIKN